MDGRLVLASGNTGKLRELQALLAPLGWQVLAQSEFGLESAPEPFPTFVENALAKARHASEKTGLPAIADDSGLCVPSLNGEPGVHSARYSEMNGGAASDMANNQLLVRRLEKCADRRAFFSSVVCFMAHASDPLPIIEQGRIDGEIVLEAAGTDGFGYDPHFYLPSHNRTLAQLSLLEKNAISHRALAMKKLLLALMQ